jgi:hypothetical protein
MQPVPDPAPLPSPGPSVVQSGNSSRHHGAVEIDGLDDGWGLTWGGRLRAPNPDRTP